MSNHSNVHAHMGIDESARLEPTGKRDIGSGPAKERGTSAQRRVEENAELGSTILTFMLTSTMTVIINLAWLICEPLGAKSILSWAVPYSRPQWGVK